MEDLATLKFSLSLNDQSLKIMRLPNRKIISLNSKGRTFKIEKIQKINEVNFIQIERILWLRNGLLQSKLQTCINRDIHQLRLLYANEYLEVDNNDFFSSIPINRFVLLYIPDISFLPGYYYQEVKKVPRIKKFNLN